MAFPDPTRPIATCSASSCIDCPVSAKIHCHFRPKDLIHFLLISFPGFIIGGAVIFAFNQWLTVVYIAIVVGFFGFLEIRVMCSHCPHYAEEGLTLSCWANHGSLKLWKYRPGPMTKAETLLFFAGLVIAWVFPLLTADNLAGAINEAVLNPDLKKRAEDIGKKIRQEDGVCNATAVIEKIMTDA